MKRIVIGGVSAALGLFSMSSQADEVYWRPVAQQPAPPQPVALMPKPASAVAAPTRPDVRPTVYRFQSGPSATGTSHSSVTPDGWVRIIPASAISVQSGEPQVDLPTPLVKAPVTELSPIMPMATDVIAESKSDTPPTSETAPPPATSSAPVTSPAVSSAPSAVENCYSIVPSCAPKWQVSAEYLLWWTKGSQVPPLLTTSPPNGANGIDGTVPGSTILIGGEDLDAASRSGARFGLVYWLDDCASYGFDARYFFTGTQTTTITVPSLQPNGTDVSLFRPFFAPNVFTFNNVALPGPFREQVTANGIASGAFTARSTSYFWGAEANYRDCLFCWANGPSMFRTDLLVGFRYLHLNEDLKLTEDAIRRTPSRDFPDEIVGTRIQLYDQFSTTNDFYGGQIGTSIGYVRNRWTADLRATVALGSNRQKLEIDGGQTRGPLAGGGTFTAVGGLLALPTNIGEYERNVLSVVPEIGLNVGYQVTDHWRAFVGYNFLYWSNVIRPGDQIDTIVDVTRVPRFVPPGVNVPPDGPRPAVLFQNTDFWAQGVSFGAEYRW